MRDDLRYSIAKDSMIIKNESLTNNGKGMAKRPDGNAEEPHATLKDINLDFQKKITLPKEVRSPIDADNEITTSDAEFPRLISGKLLHDDGFFPLNQINMIKLLIPLTSAGLFKF